ncbi:hypothetical protein PMAYCL1PPCAC_20022 [Pristionchus mayeri]|uniref:Uncharacterized protein n=1 Tax=Pristionchus mayeri TaxID=1317129 RepID=A0AAN5I2R8_9BILA|nr:hypothetical protein PMAYCL1PPCAC_20022 [Pristionchus mayeri]
MNAVYADVMVLNVNWVTNLAMLYMDTATASKRHSHSSKLRPIWIFAVDRPITSQIISLQIRQPDYEYSQEGAAHIISGKKNGMTAKLYMGTWAAQLIDLHL